MNWREILTVGGIFLKLGAISFGGPAASIALIDEEIVRKRGWLDREHFLSLLAATNLVPGPNVVEMAIHIGSVRAGGWGFFAAGVGFILPAFLIGPILPRLRQSPTAQAFLKGVNAAVVALILAVSLALFRSAIVDGWTVVLLGLALIALLRFRVDSFWLVIGGAAVGLVHFLLS